jgi:hypothetical protein
MTRDDGLVGRVALGDGNGLAGLTVGLRVGGSEQETVTDGAGEFSLSRVIADPTDPSPGELTVRAPNNQIIFRDWYLLDGRYLGVTVGRGALPRGFRQGTRPPPSREVTSLVAGVDVGGEGDLSLPRLRRFLVTPGRRIAAIGHLIAVASGSAVWMWTVEDEARAVREPIEVDVGREVLDLAADPLSGEIVLLVAARGGDAARDLVVLSEGGRLERRLSLDGTWSRLAVSPVDRVVALTSADRSALAVVADGSVLVREAEPAYSDVAFAGGLIVLSTVDALHSFTATGDLLEETAWPGRVVLVGGGPEAVFVYDLISGRATRTLAGADGGLFADLTILVGRGRPCGWWWDRSRIVTLLDDRLHWWLPAPAELEPAAPSSRITFVGPC